MTLEQYQPERIAGRDTSAGVRPCEDRWQIIDRFLSQYERPFTVLDLGANLAWFSLRTVEEHDAVAVAVDHGPYADWMESVLKANGDHANKVIGLRQQITNQWLAKLGQVEHFDVVYALSVVHHLDASFAEIVDTLRTLGSHVIVEVATEPDACGQHIVTDSELPDDATILGEVDTHLGGRRPIVHLPGRKVRQSVPYMDGPPFVWCDIQITATFAEKTAENLRRPPNEAVSEWQPGLNLQTFLRSGGFWPRCYALWEQVNRWDDQVDGHGDIRPWNFIMQGDRLALIDWHDWKTLPDAIDDNAALEKMRIAVTQRALSNREVVAMFDRGAAAHV